MSEIDVLAQYGGCNGCGRCCDIAGAWLEATPADLARWEAAGDAGEAVLRYAKRRDDGGAELWIEPDTGRALNHCPWLKRPKVHGRSVAASRCDIYNLRPTVCRRFPTSFAQAVDFDCEPVAASLGLAKPR
ncbi:MAG: YkgJ family cysteine cluster protein [Pseudomonadota bacterium]